MNQRLKTGLTQVQHPIYFDKYIGLKYTDCDCFELVATVLADELGIDIDRDLAGERVVNWSKVVDDPRPCDVVLFAHGKKRHIGLYVGDGKMLHTVEGKDSCIDKVNYATLSGFYRHCSSPSVTFR